MDHLVERLGALCGFDRAGAETSAPFDRIDPPQTFRLTEVLTVEQPGIETVCACGGANIGRGQIN